MRVSADTAGTDGPESRPDSSTVWSRSFMGLPQLAIGFMATAIVPAGRGQHYTPLTPQGRRQSASPMTATGPGCVSTVVPNDLLANPGKATMCAASAALFAFDFFEP